MVNNVRVKRCKNILIYDLYINMGKLRITFNVILRVIGNGEKLDDGREKYETSSLP